MFYSFFFKFQFAENMQTRSQDRLVSVTMHTLKVLKCLIQNRNLKI